MVPTKRFSTLLLLFCLLLQAGYKVLNDNSASLANVPKPIAKMWLAGQFPIAEFWEYKGDFLGKSSVAFYFKSNGVCEFYQVTVNDSHGYRLETLVYKKGTVKFHNNHSFTFYPTEGSKREFYNFCDNFYQNYNQKASLKDLTPQTYYYTLQSNSKGKDQLVIQAKLTGAAKTIFQAAN
ncbi:MAG: hypothetical protein M3142_03320 [Bacteroidota bacterium]|nr:hypothetical protein [Bacteroidota bacterium]